jgi:hypothetical protein
MFGLQKKEYQDWKVFYFLGDPHLSQKYKITDNLITLQCEDSYLHVMKKVVMGIEVILDIYDIQEGILRCGDDLIFSEKKLIEFLNFQNKTDYMGKLANPYINQSITKKVDYFVPNYFIPRQNELNDPMNGLTTMTIDDIIKFNEVPNVKYTGGVVTYLSKKSCQLIVHSMKNINYDLLKYYPNYGYPYIIEDIGIGFLLNTFGIKPCMYDLYSDYEINFDQATTQIACHTNALK